MAGCAASHAVPHPLRPGAAAALGAPAIAMAVTFLAFGAAVAASGLGLGWAIGASLLVYGMAGQVVLLGAVAGPVVPAVLGATAANARFLPMALALALAWPSGLAALAGAALHRHHPWAAAMRVLPGLAPERRLSWFLGFALVSWMVAGLATAAGFLAAPLLGPTTLAALVFANPLYFALLMAADLGVAGPRRAILCGVAAAPLALLLPRPGAAGGRAAGRHDGLPAWPPWPLTSRCC
ncbi:AzlC family ABC transporter permease [Siccirubricoccus deserti]